jgi:predicted enzyme related to lactoylglutathione lyase
MAAHRDMPAVAISERTVPAASPIAQPVANEPAGTEAGVRYGRQDPSDLEVVAMTGQVVHFEIPADDLERARTFYRDAFGWKVNPMPEMNYTMVSTTETNDQGMPTNPGAINGGMAQRGAPLTGPVITIDVADIESALDQVEKLGGQTVRGKEAVGNMGFAAYFADTEGNVVGLWQSAATRA